MSGRRMSGTSRCILEPRILGNVSETPTPTTGLKSTAVHLQFVLQYAPHLYRRTFLASKLRRKGNPTVRLPFVRQYAPHLYGSTFGKILGVGVTGTFLKFAWKKREPLSQTRSQVPDIRLPDIGNRPTR